MNPYNQMRKITVIALLLLSALSACDVPAPDELFDAEQLEGRVVRVVDGDSLELLDEHDQQHRIRLFGIDAPEQGQAFGRRAKESLADLVAGRTVTAHIMDEDPYGRLVALIEVDGVEVNQRLIALGMAWVYRRFADDPQWLQLEDEARAARRGLWRDPHPVRPADWRREHRNDR